jgi:hypothetical protein
MVPPSGAAGGKPNRPPSGGGKPVPGLTPGQGGVATGYNSAGDQA